MQEQIMDMLFEQEEIGWKDILVDLVKTEKMNPWDINITIITQKYIQTIKEMQEHNLRISGKILLAAAFMLRIKSTHLIDNDISQYDALFNMEDDLINEEFWQEFANGDYKKKEKMQPYTLIPKNPQPRNRKVSINDLVEALQRAMSTKKKILAKIRPVKYKMPSKGVDIMEVIRDVYHKIVYYTKKDNVKQISFTKLLPPKPSKEDKVYTFLPLLHLENQHKLVMEQANPFDEIQIGLFKKKA
jgi:segregation and condensation protein A